MPIIHDAMALIWYQHIVCMMYVAQPNNEIYDFIYASVPTESGVVIVRGRYIEKDSDPKPAACHLKPRVVGLRAKTYGPSIMLHQKHESKR